MEQRCLNCGTPLKGPYCHACGQKADDFRRPWFILSGEVLSQFIEWDGRIARSIPPFLFAPGQLTIAFMQGRRGRFVTPVRLYVVVTVFFFLVLTLSSVAIIKIDTNQAAIDEFWQMTGLRDDEDGTALSISNGGRTIEARRGDEDAEESQTADSPPAADPPVDVDPAAEGTPPTPETLEQMRREQIRDARSDLRRAIADLLEARRDGDEEAAEKAQERVDAASKRLEALGLDPDSELERASDFDFAIQLTFFARYDSDEKLEAVPDDIQARLEASADDEASRGAVRQGLNVLSIALQNPRVFNDIFNTWLPRVMVILVPFFALLLSFMYLNQKRLPRKFYFIDHLIFSIYHHAFIFVLMTLMVLKAQFLSGLIPAGITGWIFLGVMSVYLWTAMKTTYGQGPIKTTLKFLAVSSVAFVTYFSVLLAVVVYGLMNLTTVS